MDNSKCVALAPVGTTIKNAGERGFRSLEEHGHGHWYLAEDFAFSERAKRAGYVVFADSVRLRHIGRYGYSFEDVGTVLPRYTTYNLNLPTERESNTGKRDGD